MVTLNIETEMDVANGTRGEIVGIVLHPEEEPIPPNIRRVELKRQPAYVLVKLHHTRMAMLPGLEDKVVPIEPKTARFSVTIKDADGKKRQRMVKRKQLPITAAYAFTDYRAQGQTIPYVIVDIARPPKGGLSIFNLYVALSRSSGRESIRLLREFEDSLFLRPLPPELVDEDERLDRLNEMTRKAYDEGRFTLGT